MEHGITVRYYGKRFSRLFLAEAPLSQKVHSFTRRAIQRQQQLLEQRHANSTVIDPFRELNCRTSHISYISDINNLCVRDIWGFQGSGSSELRVFENRVLRRIF
jgi:hypothetical protein